MDARRTVLPVSPVIGKDDRREDRRRFSGACRKAEHLRLPAKELAAAELRQKALCRYDARGKDSCRCIGKGRYEE